MTTIDPDIARAETLPGRSYGDPVFFAAVREQVLARAWHLFPAASVGEGELAPWTLLPGVLDEPLLWSNDGTRTRCLSNVCTHRAALLVGERCHARALRCPYHGRRFQLDGHFLSMPGFEGAANFPSARDDLPEVASSLWRGLAFASLAPAVPFANWIAPIEERIDWLPLDRARSGQGASYEFEANWMLYCDNYLEGLHIPFVHRALARTLDLGAYEIELFGGGSLQRGIAAEGEPALEPPVGHRDHGRRIAGYYFWLFPSTMVNVYPWGMSLNSVEPCGIDRTRVHYLEHVWAPEKRSGGASGDLHQVELEDELVVTSVQRGARSRLYQRGRYAPAAERAVHHFHRLLLAAVELP